MTQRTPQGDASASPEETVVVYSKPSCVQCTATCRALDAAQIPYSVIDLTKDAEAMQHVMDLGHRQAPVVIAGDEHWSGYQPGRISELKSKLNMAGEGPSFS